MTITISIDVLSLIIRELITIKSVGIIAVSIHIFIVPLSDLCWECVIGVGDAVTVGIKIVETDF